MSDKRRFKCYDCSHEWEVAYGTGQSGIQMLCPQCGSSNIHRADMGGPRRGRGSSPSGGRQRGPGMGPRSKE